MTESSHSIQHIFNLMKNQLLLGLSVLLGIVTPSLPYGINVIIYPGSLKAKESYGFLKDSLVEKLQIEGYMRGQHKAGQNVSSHVEVADFRFWRKYPKNTFLVGHSFGGSKILCDFTLRDTVSRFFGPFVKNGLSNVKGLVLVNSHFNHGRKMPYSKFNMEEIKVPVLSLLAKGDKQLPFPRAIDDLFQKDRLLQKDKHYLVYNGTHDDICFDKHIIEDLSGEMAKFMLAPKKYNTNDIEKNYLWYSKMPAIPLSTDVSKTFNVFDAIYYIALYPAWYALHFLYFLVTKAADGENFQFSFDTASLIKTHNVTSYDIETYMRKVVLNGPVAFSPRDIEFKWINLPSIHPAILWWLFADPKIYKEEATKNTITIELFRLPIKGKVVYYKVPTRRSLLEIA